jgi:hypothetical protein
MLIGDNPSNNGFRQSIEYFLSQGYQKSELYGSMWGFPDYPYQGYLFYAENVLQIRKFIDAVIDYTNTTEIDVISHSLGVQYARRALQGGWARSYSKRSFSTGNDSFYIGPPLTDRIRNFIGIAGATWGNANCFKEEFKLTKTCSPLNGYWPGDQDGEPFPVNLSKFTLDLNNGTNREA